MTSVHWMKYCVVLDSFQSKNTSWKSMKEILQTKFTMQSKYKKSLDQISLSDAWSLVA
jgi:hypothetical protein